MKKIFLRSILLSLIGIAFFVNSYSLDSAVGEEIKIYLGEAKVIAVDNPTRAAIGNPAIADITSATKTEITLNPKAVGTTTLVLWDSFGEQSYRLKVLAEDINEAKRRIDNLLKSLKLPTVYTQAAEDEGKVLLLGKVKELRDKDRINTILGPLKAKTVDLIDVREEEAIVEIDVQVLELDKDSATTLGLTWPGQITISSGPKTVTGPITALIKLADLSQTAFSLRVDALVQEGKARVLSRPRVSCQSGKEAKLLVGGEVPIFSSTVISGAGGAATAGNVDYKEYGIILNIKPRVDSESGRIHLNLNVDISELGTVRTITTADAFAEAYPVTKRVVNTEVIVDNGKILALGGLIRQRSTEDITKYPWLGDIPVLGNFFKSRSLTTGGGQGQRGDTELYIILTPTIVSEAKVTPAKKESKAESKSMITMPTIVDNIPTPIAAYTRLIQKRILENLIYPSLAKEAGFQGTVKVGIHLSFQGKLLDAVIKESSGYKILDDNAISVARNIASYPPFPSSVDLKELWIEIPISYRLD
ncbi:TonB family protein [bacterium]|nr:MAG: TonB family protein [bacterium]